MIEVPTHVLDAGLDEVRAAPTGTGTLERIVARPAEDERLHVPEARIDAASGLEGDGWSQRGSRSTYDGGPDPDKQLTLMSARVARLVAGAPERWGLAGDQLYVDLDLSTGHLPAGSRLRIGADAVVEITDKPHLGCAKFRRRFGEDALRWVNSPVGRDLRLRGVNARVVAGGPIREGDAVVVDPDQRSSSERPRGESR